MNFVMGEIVMIFLIVVEKELNFGLFPDTGEPRGQKARSAAPWLSRVRKKAEIQFFLSNFYSLFEEPSFILYEARDRHFVPVE